MKSLMSLVFSMLSLFGPSLVSAEVFYIEDVRGGVPRDGADIYKELIRTELMNRRQTVTQNPSESDWVLEPSLLKLGNSYIASLSKISDGLVFFSQKLKATNIDDLDTVTERLVLAMIYNKTVGQAQEVDTVTQDELMGTTERIEVERQFYLGFGPGALSGLSASGGAVNITAGLLWSVDKHFSMRFGGDWTGGEGDADVLSLGIGGQYYFSLKKNSPYLLGLVGFSWAESNDKAPVCTNLIFACDGEDEAGWSTQVGVGYHFFRTAKVNLAAEAVYTAHFFDVANERPGVFTGRLIFFW